LIKAVILLYNQGVDRDRALQTVYGLTAHRTAIVTEREAVLADYERRLAEIDQRMIEACQVVAALAHDNGHGQVNGSSSVKFVFKPPSNQSEASEEPEESSKTYQLMRLLLELPEDGQLDYGIAAMKIYGDDNEVTRKRIRSILNTLHVSEKIRRTGRGRWEVVDT
jgi:hypothetical protein